jgi:hypothetical protein
MDQQRAFAHAGDAARLGAEVERDATAIVVDGQRDGAGRMGELEVTRSASAWRATLVSASCATR